MSKSRDTEVKKYGSEEAYRAEMRRRRGLVRNYYLKGKPEAARAMVNKRYQKEKDVSSELLQEE